MCWTALLIGVGSSIVWVPLLAELTTVLNVCVLLIWLLCVLTVRL